MKLQDLHACKQRRHGTRRRELFDAIFYIKFLFKERHVFKKMLFLLNPDRGGQDLAGSVF